jgi:hypothetical protein
MPTIRVCLTHTKFGGFSRDINTLQYSSMQDVCVYMKKQLIACLEAADLINLVEMAQELRLQHTHNMSYSEIIDNKIDLVHLAHDYSSIM